MKIDLKQAGELSVSIGKEFPRVMVTCRQAKNIFEFPEKEERKIKDEDWMIMFDDMDYNDEPKIYKLTEVANNFDDLQELASAIIGIYCYDNPISGKSRHYTEELLEKGYNSFKDRIKVKLISDMSTAVDELPENIYVKHVDSSDEKNMDMYMILVIDFADISYKYADPYYVMLQKDMLPENTSVDALFAQAMENTIKATRLNDVSYRLETGFTEEEISNLRADIRKLLNEKTEAEAMPDDDSEDLNDNWDSYESDWDKIKIENKEKNKKKLDPDSEAEGLTLEDITEDFFNTKIYEVSGSQFAASALFDKAFVQKICDESHVHNAYIFIKNAGYGVIIPSNDTNTEEYREAFLNDVFDDSSEDIMTTNIYRYTVMKGFEPIVQLKEKES